MPQLSLPGLTDQVPPPGDPYAVARYLVPGRWLRTHWRDTWYGYNVDGRTRGWVEIADSTIKADVYRHLHKNAAWRPNSRNVSNVLEALKAHCHQDPGQAAPFWRDTSDRLKDPATDFIALRNALYQLSNDVVREPTSAFFSPVTLPFDHDNGATCPEWEQFLDQLWPDDQRSIDCLQELFGYVLSGRTDLQKAFLLWGPKRSGKSTIGNTLRALVGEGNCAATTLGSLSGDFGLQPLVDKSLCVVGDARLSGGTRDTVEQLLSISGGDARTVNRKFKDHLTTQLGVRFLVLSNELPSFNDASGTIASRFVTLRTTQSHFGREDHGLADRLHLEPPGIFNWSLEGMDRLRDAGRFTEPASMAEDAEDMHDAASPVGVFVKEHCTVGTGFEVPTRDLYQAWTWWAAAGGYKALTREQFGSALRAAASDVTRRGQTRAGGRLYRGIALVQSVAPPVQIVTKREDW